MINKRGQFESKLLTIISIFIVGIIVFFMSHMTSQVYGEFDDYLETSDYVNTTAQESLQEIQDVENSSMWDYAFLAIFFGLIIQVLMFSFATRISIAFYWLLFIIDIPIFVVGIMASNIWQEMAASPEFAITITRFPITDAILGSYFPMIIVIIFTIFSVLLFGKSPQQ